MKQPSTDQFESLVLSCVDNSNYEDRELITQKQKIQFLATTLKAELGWMWENSNTPYANLLDACGDWLRGLPSACTIPFYNGEILEFWKQSTEEELNYEDQEDRAIELYWINVSVVLFQMVQDDEVRVIA
jgi:hypothetical protein